MKLCIVGGIYGMPADYQAKHALTPETILVENLREKGVDVDAIGHSEFQPSDEYDIVHVHHLGKAALRKAVADTRSWFVFTGHAGRMLCGYEKSLVRKLAFRYVLQKADALIALSRAEAQYLGRLTDREKIHVIPNGIPADVFHPDPDKALLPKENYRILFVGQLIELKGVDILLEALRRILRKWDVTLLLVYQNAELESRYWQMVKDLGIADHVQFFGFLSITDLAALYRQVDVLVLPSFAEALPSVVTEALLSGTPVVATHVGGIPEQLDKYGKQVQPGDAFELAAAIDNVLEELPRFKEQAQEASEYAKRKFSVEDMVNAHIRLYGELIEGTRDKNPVMALDRFVRLAARIYLR